jgi:hypothetical protein
MTFQEKLNKILKSRNRTDYEAKVLYEYIQDFLFFQTFNERNKDSHFETGAFINLCKKMKYEKHPAGSAIFQEGDKSDNKMYIVYSGEICIVIKKLDFYARQNLGIDDKKPEETPPPPSQNAGEFFKTQVP